MGEGEPIWLIPRAGLRGLLLALLALAVAGPAVGEQVPGDLQYQRAEDADPVEGAAFPPSIFPHWVHRVRYRCDACHDQLFEMKRSGTPVTMELIKQGKVCGACHNGEAAFGAGFESCHRCHRPLDE